MVPPARKRKCATERERLVFWIPTGETFHEGVLGGMVEGDSPEEQQKNITTPHTQED